MSRKVGALDWGGNELDTEGATYLIAIRKWSVRRLRDPEPIRVSSSEQIRNMSNFLWPNRHIHMEEIDDVWCANDCKDEEDKKY